MLGYFPPIQGHSNWSACFEKHLRSHWHQREWLHYVPFFGLSVTVRACLIARFAEAANTSWNTVASHTHKDYVYQNTPLMQVYSSLIISAQWPATSVFPFWVHVYKWKREKKIYRHINAFAFLSLGSSCTALPMLFFCTVVKAKAGEASLKIYSRALV